MLWDVEDVVDDMCAGAAQSLLLACLNAGLAQRDAAPL